MTFNLICAEGDLTNFLLGESRKIWVHVTRPRSRQDNGVRMAGERCFSLQDKARSSLLFPVLSGDEYLLHSADAMRT